MPRRSSDCTSSAVRMPSSPGGTPLAGSEPTGSGRGRRRPGPRRRRGMGSARTRRYRRRPSRASIRGRGAPRGSSRRGGQRSARAIRRSRVCRGVRPRQEPPSSLLLTSGSVAPAAGQQHRRPVGKGPVEHLASEFGLGLGARQGANTLAPPRRFVRLGLEVNSARRASSPAAALTRAAVARPARGPSHVADRHVLDQVEPILLPGSAANGKNIGPRRGPPAPSARRQGGPQPLRLCCRD